MKNIQERIQAKEKVLPDQQKLNLEGKQLDDNRILADFIIRKDSKLNPILSIKGGVQMFIKTLTGKTIILEVERAESVDNIKAKIQEQEGIPINQQRLIYGGKLLTDEIITPDYFLSERSVIHLVLKLRGGIENLAKVLSGKYRFGCGIGN